LIKPDRDEEEIKKVFKDMYDDVLNVSNPNFGDYNIHLPPNGYYSLASPLSLHYPNLKIGLNIMQIGNSRGSGHPT
jgi:hypothetical protein